MKSSKLIPWSWFRRDEAAMPSHRRVFGTQAGPLYMELDRLFDSLFDGYYPSSAAAPKGARELSEAMIRPNLDISGDDKNYYITVELPGVDEEHLHVEVENDTLRISGEKKSGHEARQDGDTQVESGRSFYRIERSYGSFQRILSLPEDVDASAISAMHKDGVLTVTMPRKALLQPEARKIVINKP